MSESEVDRYLDELFDRLAGTGAAGRRALAEAEDHLRAAVAEGTARKLPQQQAEHEAVGRFGPPARIARTLRRVHRGGWLNSVLSGGWLLAGIGLAGAGVSYLAAAVSIAVELWMHPQHLPTCADNLNRVCTDTVPVMQHAIAGGRALLALGVIALLGRRLAMRLTRLAPATRRFPLLAAVLFALAGLALLAEPFFIQGIHGFAPQAVPGFFAVPQGPGPRTTLIASAVAMAAAAATITWGLTEARKPRYLR